MTLHGFTHLALRVDDLRQAEGVYADLFDLKVAFREVENADEWWTLPPSSTWDDAYAAPGRHSARSRGRSV